MSTEQQSVQQTVLDAVRSIVRALRLNTRAIERATGMSLAQLFVLQHLSEASATSLNDLAARTATHQSSVSVVVKRLAARGYVTSTSSSVDRRRIVIELTPEGQKVLATAPKTFQSELLEGLGQLSAADQASLAKLMVKWLGGSRIDLASPPMLLEDEVPSTAG